MQTGSITASPKQESSWASPTRQESSWASPTRSPGAPALTTLPVFLRVCGSRASSLARRIIHPRAPKTALALLLTFLATAALTATPALALNPERHYEQVSPAYKGGFDVAGIGAVAADGESVAFLSEGSFAETPAGPNNLFNYLARRGGSGWSTTSLEPPTGVQAIVYSKDVSPSLGSIMAFGKPGSNRESAASEGTEYEFQFHATGLPDTSANWELGGRVLKSVEGTLELAAGDGESADFCHFLFESVHNNTNEVLLPEALNTVTPIYDLARGCTGEPASLHLLASNNSGAALSPSCHPNVGIQTYSVGGELTPNSYNAISADGKEIFFTTCVKPEGFHYQLFLRLDDARTLEVSRPLQPACGEVPCGGDAVAAARASANFAGASEDGSRVFFTTAAPLTGEDTDSGNDLYQARIGCRAGESQCAVSERIVTSLVQVSHTPAAGEAAEVQDVVAVAPNGSRAYFVARGVLSHAPNAQGAVAVRGADNLYVYDAAAGKLAFVGDLCSGNGASGTILDAHCPTRPATESDTRLWQGNNHVEEQTAGADARFLVFSSYAQLVPGDTDTALDVYRYDAQTGALVRVSGGEAGNDANGNSDQFGATITEGHRAAGGHLVKYQYEMDSRAISEDGSRIVFMSAEPLSPAATNHQLNVYEWHEQPGDAQGSVSLISSGSAEGPDHEVVISPSGNDVFFTTAQGLVAQDTDGAPDLYDARLGGGFPLAPAAAKSCAGDACQGPLTSPAPLLIPGSVSQAPGQNFAAPAPVPAVKPRPRRHPARCRRGHVKSKRRCVKRPTPSRSAHVNRRANS